MSAMTARAGGLLLAALVLGGCDQGNSSVLGNSSTGSEAAIKHVRDAKLGATYGAAGPRSCPDKKQPTSGAPTPAQAAGYAICGNEHEFGDSLFLVDNMVVTAIGKPRMYNRIEDRNFPEIDVSKPIYDLRANYDAYQCRYLSTTTVVDMGPLYKKGTNCILRRQKNASGACYVDTFGDWQCSVSGYPPAEIEKNDAAPPA